MKRLLSPSLLRPIAGATILLAAGWAQAQYVWVNANGNREYSDRPPPPSVSRSKILKAPQMALLEPAPDAAASPAADTKPDRAEKKGPPTLAERDADFHKRQKERAEQEQKAAQEAQQKQAKAENCAAAQKNKAQLESGVRITDTAANGERSFISDEERARRVTKANTIVDSCR